MDPNPQFRRPVIVTICTIIGCLCLAGGIIPFLGSMVDARGSGVPVDVGLAYLIYGIAAFTLLIAVGEIVEQTASTAFEIRLLSRSIRHVASAGQLSQAPSPLSAEASTTKPVDARTMCPGCRVVLRQTPFPPGNYQCSSCGAYFLVK